MKHLRSDRTFVYYFAERADKQLLGLRFSRGEVSVICGPVNPELIPITDGPTNLPLLVEDASESIQEAFGAVDSYPEVDRFMRAEISFEELLRLADSRE